MGICADQIAVFSLFVNLQTLIIHVAICSHEVLVVTEQEAHPEKIKHDHL